MDCDVSAAQGKRLSGSQKCEDSGDVIQIPPRPQTLAERFEDGRMTNLRLGFGILGRSIGHRSVTMIDQFGPDELAEAADEILLGHAARMAIRSVARVEQAWALYNGNDDQLATVPHEQRIADLIAERDAATAYYQTVREKQARTEHLESICARGKSLAFPKPRLTRAKQKQTGAG